MSTSVDVAVIFFGCRLDGVDFLNRWRGKKIMFVGDSLSLNMWESLACMIHASATNATTSFSRKEALSTVIFQVFSLPPLCVSNFNSQNHYPCFSHVFVKYKIPTCVFIFHPIGIVCFSIMCVFMQHAGFLSLFFFLFHPQF